MSDLISLTAQAEAGRGLWIGLFPVLPLPFEVAEDPHVTLVHCGRRAPSHLVRGAYEAAEIVAIEHHSVAVTTSGVARFRGSEEEGDPVVALVGSVRIRAMRDRVVHLLGAMLVPQTYDYTPHLTIRRVPRAETLQVAAPLRQPILLDRVGVVCGDARVYFSARDEAR